MTDTSLMPFGKYSGQALANVPAEYLMWCYQQAWCHGELREYIKDNFEVIKSEVEKNQGLNQ